MTLFWITSELDPIIKYLILLFMM